jgi:ABC-type uncharacterized transport system substrate-binding protein
LSKLLLANGSRSTRTPSLVHSLTKKSRRSATRIVPTVFVQIVDPVGSGTVASLAHPGDNATGFSTIDYRICGQMRRVVG